MTEAVADARLLKRHRELVAIIEEDLEKFARVGNALAAIRDEQTYRAAGLESFDAFLKSKKNKWGYSRRYSYYLISAASYRQELPEPAEFVHDRAQGDDLEWNEWQVRELTRLPTPRDAKRVAMKALKEVAADGGELSAAIIRKHVDADLGVKRGHAATKDKPQQMDFAQWWRRVTGCLREFAQGFNETNLRDWRAYVRDNQTAAEDLAQAIQKFDEATQRVWPELPDPKG
jgi:hypothetical protein